MRDGRVAVRRGSANAANVGALLDNPYRANAASLFAGTAEQSTRRTPRPLSWDTRSNAATNERPEIRVGARRHDSNSDNRAPGRHPQRVAKPAGQHRIRRVRSRREQAVHPVGRSLPHRRDQPE